MTTREHVPRPGRMQQRLVWFVGYVALAVSVVLAVRFAYASADTTVDALIRASAAAVAAVVGCHGPAWILRSVRLCGALRNVHSAEHRCTLMGKFRGR
jgi:uncharacterized membrane protein YbhN (UPF0104 family)